MKRETVFLLVCAALLAAVAVEGLCSDCPPPNGASCYEIVPSDCADCIDLPMGCTAEKCNDNACTGQPLSCNCSASVVIGEFETIALPCATNDPSGWTDYDIQTDDDGNVIETACADVRPCSTGCVSGHCILAAGGGTPVVWSCSQFEGKAPLCSEE